MRNGRFLVLVVCALALAALPAAAQTLTAGIDVWTTPDDGSAYVDFTDNPLPAGYFCASSQPFAQRITLKGSAIATSPSGVLGSTDTVVERTGDVDVSGGQGSTTIHVRAISFVNRTAISVPGCSDTFSAKVGLSGTAPAGSITIHSSGTAGGTFDASFSVPGKITFTNNTTGLPLRTPATETISLQTSGAPWADSVGTGGIAYPNPVSIDTNGDGVADDSTPGTTPGFAPGWSHGCNPPCPVKVDHNGPHPTWPLPPPPKCSKDVIDAVSRFEAEQADTVNPASASNTVAAEDEINVLSSTRVAGQSLAVIDSATAITPCLATTTTSTYVVVSDSN
ncbi:MAG TPA: hypothetical protein VGX68_01050 [Thermoanaerobaculia bacterium]|jgi:hypothetical protein|nr:hypothetical protein [Thermoanaerobaculia bacterium]